MTSGNSIEIAQFDIRDGGSSADGDALPTTLTDIAFSLGGNTNVRKIAIFDGSVNLAEVAGGATPTFSGLSMAAPDDGSKTFSIRASFNSAVTDNDQLQLTVASATASGSGSTFAAANAGGATTSVSGDNNRIEVAATKLNFSTQPPASTPVNTNFGAAVEAVDANGNRDLDATTSVTMGEDGAGNLSSAAGLTQGLTSGLYSWTDFQYDQTGTGIHLTTTNTGGLANATSSAFDVTSESGSTVAAGDSAEPASISSLWDTQAEAVLNFDFTVTDDGSTPGNDALPTLIDTVTVFQGSGNDIATWYSSIAGAILLDNSGNSFSGTVGATVIRFSNIPTTVGGLGYVADNATKHYRLKVWLRSDMTYLRDTVDGLNLAFGVNRSSFKTLATGSSAFAAGDGESVESGAGNNAVSVAATDVNFAYQPTSPIYRSAAFRADVEAVDINGNRDRDATDAVTLSRAAGTGNLTAGSLTQSLVSGLYSWTDLQYDVAETGVQLTAAAGSMSDDCDPFAVIESEPTVQTSGLSFSAVGETLMTVSWTPGDGAGRIVLAKAGQTVSHPPVDGEGYTANASFGQGSQIGTNNFVVYAGSGSSVTVTGMSPLTRYFFAVYEYNGSGTTSNYLTTAPDTGSQMTNATLAVGDFQSKADGNWNSTGTWDQWDGSGWTAASGLPSSGNTVYISGGDSVAVDANAACKNLILYNSASGMRLSLNAACTLTVAGTLGSADNLPGAALIKGEGLLRFTGGSRALFGSTWSANPPGWRFEVALDPGAVGTTSSGIKAGQITVGTGSFVVGTSSNNDLRPDSGSAGTGSVRVASGATLTVLGSISRTSTGTAQCGLVDIDGTLKLGGRNISAVNININSGGKLVSARAETPHGHIVTGALAYASGSTLEYNSGTSDFAQATGGELAPAVHNLAINNPAGDTLKSSVTVNGALTCQQGMLVTGNYAVTLAADAPLTESDASNVQGTVQLTRTLAQSVPDNFNGLGLTINAAGAAPGATTVVRTTGRHYGVGSNQGIDRSFSILPTVNSGLNATMVLSYREAELNGLLESELGLFRSTNNGASWDSLGGAVDAGANTLTLASIDGFSLWTAGKAGVPLAVELSSFAALDVGEGITLTWRTESEESSYLWLVGRAASFNGPYAELARLPAAGTSATPRDYTWTDLDTQAGATHYYRLGELGLDGRTTYYGPISATMAGQTIAADLSLGCAPNPFRSFTDIRYQVAKASPVSIAIYNISGQMVRRLDQGVQGRGFYRVPWDGTNQASARLANGIYLYRITVGGKQFGGKVQMVK